MSSFRPSARTTGPDGRDWEIYAYKVRLPDRRQPDPDTDAWEIPSRGGWLQTPIDGVAYILSWVPRLLLRALWDLPIAAARALRSDEWTIEAVSWAPYPVRHRWTVASAYKGQVLASVEGQLARGEHPRPRNAMQQTV